MEKRLKENVGLYSVGAFAVLIAVLGVLANTLYAETGGYGLGFALVAVCSLAASFLYSFSSPLAKVRSKGLLIFSFVITIGYLILFILSDLAYIPAMTFNFDGSKYVRSLEPLGTVSLVFEILCTLILTCEGIRLFANLFNKEFYRYESLLGTPAARRAEGEVTAEELPRKDTARLFAEADAAYLRGKMTVVELTRLDSAPTPSDRSIPETLKEEGGETRAEQAPQEEIAEEQPEEYEEMEQLEMDIVDTPAEPEAEIAEEEVAEVEIAEGVNTEVERVLDSPEYNAISNYDAGYAQDVRQDYIPTRTVQKDEDENDDIYTDFTYDGEE